MKEKVKLIRIIQDDDSYVVDAQTSTKIMGLRLLHKNKRFVQYNGNTDWFEQDKNKPVSKHKKEKLDTWLSNHKKYIE